MSMPILADPPDKCPQCGGGPERIRHTHTDAEYRLYQCECNYVFVRHGKVPDATE